MGLNEWALPGEAALFEERERERECLVKIYSYTPDDHDNGRLFGCIVLVCFFLPWGFWHMKIGARDMFLVSNSEHSLHLSWRCVLLLSFFLIGGYALRPFCILGIAK